MADCALVTGGSRGIGRAISIALAKELGLHVLVNYKSNLEAAEATVAMIREAGGFAEPMAFDVAVKAEVDRAMDEWTKTHPDDSITVLVNNAGVTSDNLLVFMDESGWDKVVDTSLKGMYNVTTSVLRGMVRRRYGRIINIVSISGIKGLPGQVNYSAAKGGVIAATRSLAMEVAKRNITVNAIAPGFIDTDMTADLDQSELKKLIPMARFGTAEEVANLAVFIASDKSTYITGEVINISGGIT